MACSIPSGLVVTPAACAASEWEQMVWERAKHAWRVCGMELGVCWVFGARSFEHDAAPMRISDQRITTKRWCTR